MAHFKGKIHSIKRTVAPDFAGPFLACTMDGSPDHEKGLLLKFLNSKRAKIAEYIKKYIEQKEID